MKSEKQTLLLPALLITVGIGWLLTALEIAPHIDWVWTISLGGIGLLAFALGGIDKVTVVVGPFFILASFFSILRQTDRLHLNVEGPILVIVAGILLLLVRSPAIPIPRWMVHETTSSKRKAGK